MKGHIKAAIAAALAVAIMLSVSACAVFRKENNQITTLYLYGDMAEMYSKKDERSVTAVFKQGNQEINCHAKIKIQGTSSIAYEKKNYTIKFYEDAAHETKKAVDLGWGAQNEYCLKANWIDKTHSRNVVTAKLAAEVQSRYGLMEQAPCNGLIDGFPVEVYINDQYHGIYTWNIPKSAWMFGMDEENPNHIVLCGEDWQDPALFRAAPDFVSWAVEVGPESEETLEKFTRLTTFIMDGSDEAFKADFDAYLNLDAMLNYYILVDFAYLPDNRGKNMLMVTYDGEVWYPSLYDLDTSWGAHYTGKELWNYEDELANFGGPNRLAKRMEQVFSQELHDRYFELREALLTKEHVMELFAAFDESIPKGAKTRETERWGEEIPGYDLTQIEHYLDTIIERLDEKYANLVK